MSSRLTWKMRLMSDKSWLKLLNKSITSRKIDGVEFPGFPEDQVQVQFVGSANENTLKEAFDFYVFMKQQARHLGNPIGRQSRFLDFGCGWGRYLRFFWKDVEEENLVGCDVNKMIVETCQQLNLPGHVDLIEPDGRLPYPDGHFTAMMAYSVFTHLPEKVHMHWMKELARVAAPGCVFCLTLEPRRFLDFIAGIPQDTDSTWYKGLAAHKPRLPGFLSRVDAGQFVFMPTNEGVEDLYGDAVVPLSFIEHNWSPYFRVCNYLDDPRRFWQAVLVVQRI